MPEGGRLNHGKGLMAAHGNAEQHFPTDASKAMEMASLDSSSRPPTPTADAETSAGLLRVDSFE
jgi:hypothetical protein